MNNKYIKFACVGGIGFIVDLSAMIVFSTLMPLYAARLLAFFFAVNSNWLLNRSFTFKAQQVDSDSGLLQQWSKFLCSSCFGAIPNLLCYWLLVSALSLTGTAAILAIIPGIIFGMFINYLLADRWVFAK
ncbi:GtrA family protein [Moritella dasanensis]|uniref:GtrA family protein n=1 Tax=Moritella dasanensis TaxID=428031 RepID=UPI000307B99A|nr:GtrA family protein [Moritella dasanensis]